MPDGTIQDSRQQPDEQAQEKNWGYLKVRDPKQGIPGNCEWNEYMLYLDHDKHNLMETTHCEYDVVEANLEYPKDSGIKRPIEIAILKGAGNNVPFEWFRQLIIKEAPKLANALQFD